MPSITDKTLVSWFCFDEEAPKHCSVITVQAADKYDALAFGQDIPGKWSIASEDNIRTQTANQLVQNPDQEIILGKFMMMAAVFKDNSITIYRDGEVYANYTIEEPVDFLNSPYLQLVIGTVNLNVNYATSFKGKVKDVRIYSHALTQEQLNNLKPNEPSEIQPFSWYDFSIDGWWDDRAGKFPEFKNIAAIKENEDDPYIVFDHDNRHMFSMDNEAVRIVRDFRQRLMHDPSRPTYHLVNSDGDNDRNYSTDPNFMIHWKGQYHFGYMYKGDEHAFGHFTSIDLVHWRRRRDCALGSGGCGTGGTIITKDGEKVRFVGIFGGRATYVEASDEHLEDWSKPIEIDVPQVAREADYWTFWDPTAWVEGDYYYIFTGDHAMEDTRPELGNWYKRTTLMRSKDFKQWEFLGEFMTKELPGLEHHDHSCTDFFKLGNKHMMLLISHGWGARYYLGEWKDNKFTPEYHTKMSWSYNYRGIPIYWAPKTFLTPDGRRVVITNLQVNLGNTLWSCVFSLPWELSLPEDGIVRIKPVRELEILRYNEIVKNNILVKNGKDYRLKEIFGDTIELNITIKPTEAKHYGVKVFCDKDNQNGMEIFLSADDKTFSIGDGNDEQKLYGSSHAYGVAPFELKAGEDLNLRVFIDRALVEVFINERQAVVQSQMHKPEDVGICLFSIGGDIMADVTGWKMAPANQW
ncbi:MAG: GH32 C-terminal domain-containing protein [Candidatus Poribacteria bacterium]|nr:GH32 C-terminal domain-containing protein [Candidatus Poribacteria bacterium]